MEINIKTILTPTHVYLQWGHAYKPQNPKPQILNPKSLKDLHSATRGIEELPSGSLLKAMEQETSTSCYVLLLSACKHVHVNTVVSYKTLALRQPGDIRSIIVEPHASC